MMRLLLAIAVLTLASLGFGCKYGANNSNNGNGNVNANANNANSKRGAAPTREEYDKNKESYAKQAKDAGSRIGKGADDLWLWVKTRAALAAVDDLSDSTINIDVNNGVVTLKGNVDTQDQVRKADAAAKGVEGVKRVNNQLKVAGGNSNGRSRR